MDVSDGFGGGEFTIGWISVNAIQSNWQTVGVPSLWRQAIKQDAAIVEENIKG